MLKTATVVDDDSKSDEVGMDDIVEVEFEEDGEVEKYKLVTSIRGNSMENRVSIESPIGKALKGHRRDLVTVYFVNVNENVSYYLRIKSIDKTGDEGENIRSFLKRTDFKTRHTESSSIIDKIRFLQKI